MGKIKKEAVTLIEQLPLNCIPKYVDALANQTISY